MPYIVKMIQPSEKLCIGIVRGELANRKQHELK